ncbi:MAG: 50S ribosomal protein L9 [Anaerolineae bacterium]|nr:50S ribosomal protein L9 [Anaerolineae bacterium]
MKVFLKRDVPDLGKANEIKTVSDGYARNYLFPNGLAVPATPGQIKSAQEHTKTQAERQSREKTRALEIAEQLRTTPLRLKAKAGEKGRLYGSITSADVAEAMSRVLGFEFDKRAILMDRPIRELGEHVIELKLKGGVRGQARVVVESEA